MENGGESLIKLDNVSKVFVTDEVETHALAGIHFDVKKGEYLSISGPSGCGKSTLLAILGLLDTPTDGTYYLNGKPVTVIDTVVAVCGKVPRPSVVYVLTVKNIDYEWESLKQDFLPKILQAASHHPF